MPRKKPFSTKQKKQQLQQKKNAKKERQAADHIAAKSIVKNPIEFSTDSSENEDFADAAVVVKKINCPPLSEQVPSKQLYPNRFNLHFEKDSDDEVEKKKERAKTVILAPVPETELEVAIEDIYHPGILLDIPKRPAWSYSMTKTEVERQEEDMFAEYVKRVRSTCQHQDLSYFELNLETWRQLWRVLEISDIVLLVADVRHPVLHFSPFLYRHVVHEMKKQLVLILNKVDLIPCHVAVAWRHYFMSQFPDMPVVYFSCYSTNYVSDKDDSEIRTKLQKKGKTPFAVGTRELFDVIEKLSCGKAETADLCKQVSHTNTLDTDEAELSVPVFTTTNVLTIGLVGYPNVGKSSILNGLMGKKHVSTSKTPGHTKHLQTIFLTPNVRLCDCPGLVFPSLIDKRLQILCGIYPIAQVKEPYTSIGYLAERVPLIDDLHLSHPQEESGSSSPDDEIPDPMKLKWTAWDICDAWAKKKRYYTAKAARLDTYRAANHLLRLSNEGRICLFFRPPNFSSMKDEWERHEDVTQLILMMQQGLPLKDKVLSLESSSDNEAEDYAVVGCSNKFATLLDIDDES